VNSASTTSSFFGASPVVSPSPDGGDWAAAAAARLAERWDVPFLATEHFSGFQRGAAFAWEVRLARRSLHQARQVLTVSQPLKSHLVSKGLAPAGRTSVLPNMVDTRFFRPPERTEGGPSARSGSSPFRFMTLGKLVKLKGHHVLLEAFAQFVERIPTARLEIGGSGPERAALERQAAQLGIGQQVLFIGQLSRHRVRQALWRADAFVQPSLQETFGVVLIEAMATGLPVVATRCGGPEDFVRPHTGLLTPRDDPTALAHAMREVIRRRSFFQTSTIRTYIKQRFGAEAVVRRLMHFYREALRR
jgi:glycosyltransferase involved in cell wall biosynthesis